MRSYEFTATKATHVKISFTNDDATDKANLYEIEVMGKPANPTANVALDKPVTTSPVGRSDYPSSCVTDGDITSRFAPSSSSSTVTVTIDLEGTYLVDSVNVIDFANRNDLTTANRTENIKIELLVGGTWYTVVEKTDQELGTVIAGLNHSNLRAYDFEAHLAEQVRITFVNAGESSADTPTVFEIEVMGESLYTTDEQSDAQ